MSNVVGGLTPVQEEARQVAGDGAGRAEGGEVNPLTDIPDENLDAAMAERIAGKVVDHAYQILAEKRKAVIGALETQVRQMQHQIECSAQEYAGAVEEMEAVRRQRDELVLALMWCKPRLKQEAYQNHIEWTLTKYPKPPKVDEPRVVRSFANPDDDFCPSDPRGPGRTGGE